MLLLADCLIHNSERPQEQQAAGLILLACQGRQALALCALVSGL